MTDARPATAPAPSRAPAGSERGGWFTTGDHKRLGVVQLYLALACVIGGLVGAFAFQVDGDGDEIAYWTNPFTERTSAAVTFVLAIGLPVAWMGLFTHVVPLQVGARRLALPRLHALAVWMSVAGAIVAVLAFLVGGDVVGSGLASPGPAAALEGRKADTATLLWVVGLALVALALVLAAISIITTVAVQRSAQVRLVHLPPFALAGLATALVTLVATPAFLAGLFLLYIDQRHGGTLFASEGGAVRIWQHLLWLFGRPEAFLLAAPALGVLADVVATNARRPLAHYPIVRAGVIAAPLLAVVAWAARSSALEAVVVPTTTALSVVGVLPYGLVVLALIPTLARGRPRAHPSLIFGLGFVLLAGLGALNVALAAVVEVDHGPAWTNGHITAVLVGAPIMA
ncbi:MAG: cbb3-type cytochrome c oxidase subunit I, partial [Acidimicrobiales bacterium]